MYRQSLPPRILLPAVLSATLLLSGCGGSSTSSPGDSDAASTQGAGGGSADSVVPDTSGIVGGISEDATLAATLPPALTSSGALKVGSNVQSPPNNFYAEDGKTPVGFEVDLITAIGRKLGLETAYQDMAFDSLITSLSTGRVDITIAGMNDTAERQKTIDFVDYFTSGITIMVQKGNPVKISASADLCGKKVAVVQGTTQEDFASEQTKECAAAGQDALQVTATPSDSQNQTQLRTGRVDAILNDLPTAVYISKTAGKGDFFQTVDQAPINGGPYGIGINKQQPELTAAVSKALQQLIEDGTYGEILKAWDVSTGGIEKAVVNGG